MKRLILWLLSWLFQYERTHSGTLIASYVKSTRANLRAIEHAQRCLDFEIPYFDGYSRWFITKIDVKDNAVNIYGIPTEEV